MKRLSYEDECKDRIARLENAFRKLANQQDPATLDALKEEIEIQLALADLRLKVRQADHAKAMIWLPTTLPVLGAIIGVVGTLIGTLIGIWLKH